MHDTESFQISSAGPGSPRVLLIYTGGTIGMVHGPDGLRPLDFGSLMAHLPALASIPLDLRVTALREPIDSSQATPELWVSIASLICSRYERHDAFVVLHGTDTMAYSASALSFMLAGLTKPVIFTGAQRPLSLVRSDARENLVTAIAIAAQQRVREVAIFFDRLLMRGNRVTKVAVERFDAFASPNHPPLARAGVEITYEESAFLTAEGAMPGSAPFGPDGAAAPPTPGAQMRCSPHVASLRLFPGISRDGVEALLGTRQLAGLVIEAYGAGNAPSLPWLLEAVAGAVDRGVVAVSVTQCLAGSVAPERYAAGSGLARAGVRSGADMTFEAAVTKLMVLLGGRPAAEAAELISVPLAGELTVR